MKGRLCDACERLAVSHGCETWVVTADDIYRLERNGASMFYWLCKCQHSERKIKLKNASNEVCKRRLCWKDDVLCMDKDSYVKKCHTVTARGSLWKR